MAIARALACDPTTILCDEATSALDNLTQKEVLTHIMEQRCTVLMVAHRLSTVKDFDRIIMLESGKIAEEGNYEALMEMDGKFAELVHKQLIEEEKEKKKEKGAQGSIAPAPVTA